MMVECNFPGKCRKSLKPRNSRTEKEVEVAAGMYCKTGLAWRMQAAATTGELLAQPGLFRELYEEASGSASSAPKAAIAGIAPPGALPPTQ